MENLNGKNPFLPDHHVTAKNLSKQSENKIHDDAFARTYGYRGGLVPGVSIYAYMTHPVVALWGKEWLASGRAHASFSRPIFEGDRLTIKAKQSSSSMEPSLDALAINQDGEICAACKASLPPQVTPLFEVTPLPEGPALKERIPVSWDAIRVGEPLRPFLVDTSAPEVATYAQEHGDELDVYRSEGGHVHPGFLLVLANRVFVSHFILEPWLHVESTVQNFMAVQRGNPLKVQAVPLEKFEKKGHRFVRLQVLYLSEGKPVQQVLHTAIFQIRRPS